MKEKTVYICSSCGHESPVWEGRCSNCGEWGTLEEISVSKNKKSSPEKNSESKAQRLRDIEVGKDERYKTSMEEFNRVMGGGIVKDSVTILTAKPGAGKSTLLLEIARDLAGKGLRCLYLSGEESESQIRSRADRIIKDLPEKIWILSTVSMDRGLEEIRRVDADIIIADSIQTFCLEEFSSRPGSPSQTIECAGALVDICKDKKRPRACFMVGHVTKKDELAGLRTLEHLVDTVLYLEGESDETMRILSARKNRFGRTGEIGLFNMEEAGMIEVKDPSSFFVTKRKREVVGSAITVVKEGSRMLTAEVESLVSLSYLPYPERIGDFLRKDQLNTLVSILEERAGFNLSDRDIVIRSTGGIDLNERSCDLAVMMSIVSSLLDKGISSSTVFLAEVGLTGELKNIPSLESRLDELDRLGYKRVYISSFSQLKKSYHNLQIKKEDNIKSVCSSIFN